MRTTVVAPPVLILATLAACSSAPGPTPGASPALLGTWVEIVNPRPANPVDGRQVIERFSDGRFKLVFVRTHPSKSPCTGHWSLSGTSYRMTFESVSCFSDGTAKPAVGQELTFELLSAEPSRLKFLAPAGVPLAPWQARLEGGIE
jgi:hypothetical protein